MTQIKIITPLYFFMVGLISCSGNAYRYVDLNTGKRINVIRDTTTGYRINAETKEPLMVYYDSKTRDTLFGKTGEVINNKIIVRDGKYYYKFGTEKQVK